MTIRRGQHGRNIGRRGFSHHNTGHRSRGMGRSQNRERSHQETVDHELAMSLQGEEDQRGGGWDEYIEAVPSVSPLLAQQPAGFLQDDHQMQHEWSRPLQDIQQDLDEDLDEDLEDLDEDLDEEQLEFQDHHRRRSQEMAASQQEFSLQDLDEDYDEDLDEDLDEELLEFQNHHRRRLPMGTSDNFDRVLSMLNETRVSIVGNRYEALLELGDNLGTVSSGLTSEECSTLPTARYTQRDKNTADCSVCLEKYKTGDAQKTLPCIHIFHEPVSTSG
ncbi:BB-like protein [Mya arenaria]|uniref:BB-like protein n=1 Tax=Mya arenaria TaxID=6604 RepID=A0ABY7E176_MYAAR|nr:BB-like protein [Mya arenaria]